MYGYDALAKNRATTKYEQERMQLQKKMVVTEKSFVYRPRKSKDHVTTLSRELVKHNHSLATITYLKVKKSNHYSRV